MAHVLIVGASKGIGLACVTQALQAGHDVRALARSAHGIAVESDRLETVSGDARSPAAIAAALEDIDAVILALGVAAGPDMVLWGTRLFSSATRLIVDGMRQAGVGRLICVTGFGAGDSRWRGGCLYDTFVFPLFLRRVYDDKDVQEWIIRKSGLDWVIARPGFLTSGPRTGTYRVLTHPEQWRLGSISRADVADFLVAQIERDEFVGQTPVLIS